MTSDHLGSPRINTDANGTVISRHDYQPFGEEIARPSYGGDEVRKQFTAYERDIESDLDFAQARYYKSAHGRFTTTDKVFMTLEKPSNPQTLNLYVYVRNNPLQFVDPTGNLLRATGSEVWRYLRDLESIIGVDLSVDGNGIVQTNSPIPNDLSAVAQQLLDIIQNPFTLVDVEATSGRDDVNIASFLGGGRQIIDYGDIDLVSGGNGFSARSIIAHETIEANSGLLNGVPIGSSLNQRDHTAGINAENEVRSRENLPLRVLGTDRPESKLFSSITTYRTQFGEYEQIITVEETTDGFGPRAKRTGSKITKSEVVFLGDPPSSCNR